LPEGPPAPPVPVDHVDPTFGPLITIEDIRVVGNRTTAERLILRAVPLRQGEQLRAADPRLTKARFKGLALGYFRDVTVALEKGSARGRVIVVVTVVERGTVVLNRLWYGSSKLAPYWLGLDLTERNVFGTGILVGGGLVYAGHGNVVGARDQWGAELRLGAGNLGGSRWGAHGAFQVQRGSEVYRVSGPPGSGDNDDLAAFPYRRTGVRGGPSFELTPTISFDADLRVEQIDADVPTGDRVLDDGRVIPLDLGLDDGKSRVVSLAFGFDRDTRTDPVLPHEGSRIQAQVEVGAAAVGGSYDFAVALARYEHWWPVRPRHALGLRIAGGAVIGDAPRFDRIHVGDVNRLLTPRVMGMTVAAAGSPDFLGTDNSDAVYGELGGNLIGEWSYRWFRRPKSIYGGDLFVAAGVWGLASQDAVKAVGASGWDAMPVDLVLDAGLRIDTELGIFEFTIANALGRVPRW
jgi:outer membrane protein assembly factor BamA